MDRRQLSHLAHRDHPVAAPLDDASVGRLLTLALPRGDERVLDLGCGEAAWLLRALTDRSGGLPCSGTAGIQSGSAHQPSSRPTNTRAP